MLEIFLGIWFFVNLCFLLEIQYLMLAINSTYPQLNEWLHFMLTYMLKIFIIFNFQLKCCLSQDDLTYKNGFFPEQENIL